MRYKILYKATGKSDKNGLTVFQGDIVFATKDNSEGILGVVAWDTEAKKSVIIPLDLEKYVEEYEGKAFELEKFKSLKDIQIFNY